MSDVAAFEAFAQARWSRLVRAAVLLGIDAHAAEDAVQTTLAKCYFKWDRITSAQDPDAYAHRILINTINHGRRRKWHGERPTADLPDGTIPDDALRRVDQQWAIVRALRNLPLGQREVIVLRYYADLTEAQTAQALRVSLGTVKSRCSRGLTALAADPSLRDEEDG